MQLTPSAAPTETALPALPGLPASDPPSATGADPVQFDSLLPGQDKAAPAPGKKPAPGSLATGAEAASAIWATWLAALAPAPAPAVMPTDGTGDIAGDATASVAEQSGGGAGTAPGVVSAEAMFSGAQSFFAARPDSARVAGESVRALAKEDPPASTVPGAAVSADAVNPTSANAALAAARATAEEKPGAMPLPADMTLAAEKMTDVAFAGPRTDTPAPSAPRKGREGISGVAKFAASPAGLETAALSAQNPEDKKILGVTRQQVTEHESGLGTSDAMTTPVSTFATKVPAPTSAISSGSATSAQLQPVPFTGQPVSAGDISLLAHRAVDAVKSATEYLDAGNRTTVRLQFSVGDANLSVHVELRAGQIHATFRTDSGELRAALASEWQVMSGDSGRAVRLADPVFASATGNSNGFGDSTSQQRNSGERAPAANFEAAFSSAPARASSAPAPVTDRRPAPLRANVNLYTFA
jgi:hypothetical protein